MIRVPLEVWGGLECTRVRIGDEIRDQMSETGHDRRPADLDLIADLEIRILRYPVLWETVCSTPGESDWAWHDLRLRSLWRKGIRPIAGLMHHGSGPRHCDVLDPEFPQSLALHAGAVARRYPWIDRFTPVNEPMTTARLSGLYGHWYPHGRDEATCFRVVVAECRAIAASMKAIRRVTPEAMLVQTEDIGRIFASPLLEYQADYENERRWLALDLLAGRVAGHHPFCRRLLDHGIDQRHLAELADDPCSPDIIGIDQYLTSDRFLDHSVENHPGETVGGNGRHIYVDVAAARVGLPEGELGFLPRIREAWQRYGRPLALTEVHNGSTRDEQLRWLMDGWNAASAARDEGVDIRAVSIWSLFGATDWNSLLTRREGFYEPGAFDIRFDPPRPTAIAQATRALARAGRFDHPALARSGWWKSDARYRLTQPLVVTGSEELARLLADCADGRRLDVEIGATPSSDPTLASGERTTLHAEVSFRSGGRVGGKRGALTLTCIYPAAGDQVRRLLVEADHSINRVQAMHAFLDLILDGTAGGFRMMGATPGLQHTFAPLTRDDPFAKSDAA